MRRIAVKVRDTIATATNAARFSTNDEDFFTLINRLLLDGQKKIVIIACIELDVADEKGHKVRMSIWMQKLKQKLSWLHAAKISINPVENISDVLPDTEISFL
jgi:dTDP-D-glucose 4,6-dehydratase